MRLVNIIAAYRHIPFLPKRALYRRFVNWIETKRAADANEKKALIKLDQETSFEINVDINTWIGKEIFYFGKFELFTYRFFLANIKPGCVFIDAGANIGFYSLMSSVMSGENGRTHCFEPTNKFFSKLEKNIKLNKLSNLTLNKMALGECRCQVSIKVGVQTASISSDGQGEIVEQVTLDDYFDATNNKLDFIKIDVDGHELQILSGARKTITAFRPLICVEISRIQNDCNAIFDFLTDAGYRVFHENNSHKPMDAKEFQNQLETVNGFNIISIPHEREYQLW